MGDIERILASMELPAPNGWNRETESHCLPFTVELHEDIHIHWQDIRIEMEVDDFDKFVQGLRAAHDRWTADGKPRRKGETVRYGWWPGEENYDFHRDRDIRYNQDGELCHHFSHFPRTQGGKLHFDSVLQIELQRKGQIHIHHKNFRWELGPRTFLSVARMFNSATREYHRKTPSEVPLEIVRNNPLIRPGSVGRMLGKLKRWMIKWKS